MKFTNLVVPVGKCSLGEYVRLSKTTQIVQIISKDMFIRVRLISGGNSDLEPSRNVHRQID